MSNGTCCGLHLSPLSLGCRSRVNQQPRHRGFGNQLAQQLEVFGCDFLGQKVYTSDVTTRPTEARDITLADRIVSDVENDRDVVVAAMAACNGG